MITFSCPKCSRKLKALEAAAGRSLACPGCKQRVRVPELELAAIKADLHSASAAETVLDSLELKPSTSAKAVDPPASFFSDELLDQRPPEPISSAAAEATFQQPWLAPVPNPQPPPAQHSRMVLPESRQYWALSAVGFCLRVLALLVVAAWLFFLLALTLQLVMPKPEPGPAEIAIGVLIVIAGAVTLGAALVVCLLVAASELIKLAMDVQDNTLATAQAAQDRVASGRKFGA